MMGAGSSGCDRSSPPALPERRSEIGDETTSAATEATGGDGALLVDLSAVEYLDSAAINTLAAHADRIELVAHPILMPVLRISGLTELTTIESAPPTAGQ